MSRVVFQLAEFVANTPEARHALKTAASLLRLDWRVETPTMPAAPGELPVWVGPRSATPADCPIAIPVESWEPWPSEHVMPSEWAGLPILVLARTEDGSGTSPAGDDASVANTAGSIPPTLLRAVAFLVQREEERHLAARRDQWNCFAAPFSRLDELGLLERPLVNHWMLRVEQLLQECASARGTTLEPQPLWPGGARFAVALTHDVDWTRRYSWRDGWRSLRRARSPRDYAFRYGLTTLANSLRSIGRPDPYWTFDRWAEAESRRGFRSSFFVCPPDEGRNHEYDPTYEFGDPVEFRGARTTLGAMFRSLAGEAFEIGVHGSYRSHLDPVMLARQRTAVGNVIGKPVTGIRQHFLRFDSSRTPVAQDQAGFRHDATLGYNEKLGFRAGIAAPFEAWDSAGRRPLGLMEIPTTVMDGALFRTMRLDASQAIQATRDHLRTVEAVGGLAVLLWHPNATDSQAFPGWWECHEAALDHLAGRPAWVTSAERVREWWNDRRRASDSGS